MVGDPFIQTDQSYNNIFVLSYGHPTPATNIAKLEHRVREPARMVNMVPELSNQSLLNGGKFAEAGYVSVCDGDEVKIYDGQNATITMSEDAVLKRLWCPRTKLWRISFRSQVIDINIHTLLRNAPTGRKYVKSMYTVPTSASVLYHIKQFNTDHVAGETINNSYNSQAWRARSNTSMRLRGSQPKQCGSRSYETETTSPGR